MGSIPMPPTVKMWARLWELPEAALIRQSERCNSARAYQPKVFVCYLPFARRSFNSGASSNGLGRLSDKEQITVQLCVRLPT